MATIKKFLRSPAATVLAFVLAAGLLLFSSIGGARAALTYFSETYASRVQMYDIGVTLQENAEKISWRDYGSRADGTWNENTGVLVGKMLAEGESLALNKPYKEELNVSNTGTINHYLRVTIYKYWIDQDGKKLQNLDPNFIKLRLVNLDSAWLEDTSASTPERTVLYYNRLLIAGRETPLFADQLIIDGALTKFNKTVDNGDGSYTTVYDYDGAQFCLEVRVDAVQENNAEAAILSAWGRQVSVNSGTLALR